MRKFFREIIKFFRECKDASLGEHVAYLIVIVLFVGCAMPLYHSFVIKHWPAKEKREAVILETNAIPNDVRETL